MMEQLDDGTNKESKRTSSYLASTVATPKSKRVLSLVQKEEDEESQLLQEGRKKNKKPCLYLLIIIYYSYVPLL